MTGFRRDYGKTSARSGEDIKFLTMFVDKQKIRNCELEGSKESAPGTVRQPEAVFINKGDVKHTCLRLG
jgi:hypothetical protein